MSPERALSSDFRRALLKPNLYISENDKNYEIAVEVPGDGENDIKLELANGTLTISGVQGIFL